ncbi:MAG: MucB/RseB C-terminal domain-containing protein [Betaproteobacteria bacterium]|nr:MucB/RseB C-terminal domain-containing protein [Betaproteobacteria bacterium]
MITSFVSKLLFKINIKIFWQAPSLLLIISLLALLSNFQSATAENISSSDEALGWLKKMAVAPRSHNYLGTFIYYADGHMETSHITHLVGGNSEQEKIEVLDGMPRIVYRNNDEMKCYLPEGKKIYTEKRWFRKFFPDLLPQPFGNINENYQVTMVNRERVAGYESQSILLTPRDSLRYAHQFWIHVDTGLLLKVAVMNADEIIEQFAFAQLEINGEISHDIFKTDQIIDTSNWQTTNLKTMVLKKGELKWQIKELPTGFSKIIEMKRNLVGKPALIDHIALSDGLATVSVFIEPITENSTPLVPGFYSSRGAINIYVRILEDYKITTVGEVPLEAIKRIGDSVFSREFESTALN